MMSYVDHTPPIGAARVGAELRAARERLGWQLPELAHNLRIRQPYLDAIEAGRVADLPGNAYAVGFVRTYAATLGLDPDEVSRRFRAEAQGVNRKTELAFPAPVPERGMPAGAVVLLGVLIAVAAYAGWYRYTGERAPDQVVADVPERLALLIAPAAPPPPAAVVAPELQEASAPVPPLAVPDARPDIRVDARIVLRSRADSWMQVREKQGPVLLNRVLRVGETWTVPARPNLLLTTGNAGGTELVVDGVAAPSLGAAGAIRRDVPLDPEQIKAGRPAASISTARPQAQ